LHTHADDPSPLVVKQLEGALAALLKRGWLEATDEERGTFFEVRGK
jgi:hypothetical protein